MTIEPTEQGPDIPQVAFKLAIKLLGTEEIIELEVSLKTNVGEIHQALYDSPKSRHRTCFHLAFNGKTLKNLSLELGAIEGFSPESELNVVCGKNNQFD